MIDAIKEVTGVDFNTIENDADAMEAAKKLEVEIDPIKTTRGDIINQVFEAKVEETSMLRYPYTLFHSTMPDKTAHMYGKIRIKEGK